MTFATRRHLDATARPAGLLLVLLLATSGRAQDAATSFAVPEDHLTLDLTSLPDLVRQETKHPQVRASWSGRIGGAEAHMVLWVYPRQRYGFDEPDDITRFLVRAEHGSDPGSGFAWTSQELVEGAFGYVPYAALATASLERNGERGDMLVLCGITADNGYEVKIETASALDDQHRKAVLGFLRKGIEYDGETRDWKWTDAEARRRWEEYTDEKVHDQLKIRRTKHYIILFNAGGRLFARKMEEFYREIQKTYPFPEVAGRRLMPVFLFRTRQEYVRYYSRIARISEAAAGRSKGHAWHDYYATYYESPNDPVHIHEATHQVFRNRLHLSGGGSWFQEGVAEHMSASYNAIHATVRNQIKYGDYVPFRKLMVVPSLLHSTGGSNKRGGSNAGNEYFEAASIIKFLLRTKFGRAGFERFVHEVGRCPSGDLDAIEAAIQRVYQTDIDGLEQRWVKFWRK